MWRGGRHDDEAYGARAMHSLQSYGEEEPVYDANAYTYGAVSRKKPIAADNSSP